MSTQTRRLLRQASVNVKRWNRQHGFVRSPVFRKGFEQYLREFAAEREAVLLRHLAEMGATSLTPPGTSTGIIQNLETGEWERTVDEEASNPSSEELHVTGRNTPCPESSPDGTPTTSSSCDSPSEPGSSDSD